MMKRKVKTLNEAEVMQKAQRTALKLVTAGVRAAQQKK